MTPTLVIGDSDWGGWTAKTESYYVDPREFNAAVRLLDEYRAHAAAEPPRWRVLAHRRWRRESDRLYASMTRHASLAHSSARSL